MAASTQSSCIALIISLIFLQFCPGSYSATLNLTNKCNYTVWPGILSGAGTLPLSTTGFALQPGESHVVVVPPAWSGSLWGRTLCSNDSAGRFSCVTGDCGSSTVECDGGKAAAPVTIAEFTLDGAGSRDFFDVSFVEGFNLPMIVEPQGGTGDGNCTVTGCRVDLNTQCPMDLTVTYGGRNVACKPSSDSQFFKSACQRAYSYVYDDSSIFSCASTDYTITFCPQPSTSLMGPSKNYPTVMDNLGGHEEGSYNTGTAAAIAVVICGLLIACTIRMRISNKNWELNVVAGRFNKTIAHVPQPTVEMVGC